MTALQNTNACEPLDVSLPEASDPVGIQQLVAAVWVRDNLSRCTWEHFLAGLGCPLNTVTLTEVYDQDVFGQALTAAIFNQGVIDALTRQIDEFERDLPVED
jgi:hypothetical protein